MKLRDLGPNDKRSRPSQLGVLIGRALSNLEAVGREAAGKDLPPTCSTCAFRPGCMTNQMPETGLIAWKCAVGADKDRFACHHGMRDGDPTRLCAGYNAAIGAPWDRVKEISAELAAALPTSDDNDPIREAFDAWIAVVDPTGALDDYERGRLYIKAFPAGGVKLHPSDPTGAADSQSEEPAGPTVGAKTPSPPLTNGEPETP